MSYVNAVLNELTFAAMPAMNAATMPAIATPSTPLGNRSRISSSSALLNVTPPPLKPGSVAIRFLYSASSGEITAASMPGITMTRTTRDL